MAFDDRPFPRKYREIQWARLDSDLRPTDCEDRRDSRKKRAICSRFARRCSRGDTRGFRRILVGLGRRMRVVVLSSWHARQLG